MHHATKGNATLAPWQPQNVINVCFLSSAVVQNVVKILSPYPNLQVRPPSQTFPLGMPATRVHVLPKGNRVVEVMQTLGNEIRQGFSTLLDASVLLWGKWPLKNLARRPPKPANKHISMSLQTFHLYSWLPELALPRDLLRVRNEGCWAKVSRPPPPLPPACSPVSFILTHTWSPTPKIMFEPCPE